MAGVGLRSGKPTQKPEDWFKTQGELAAAGEGWFNPAAIPAQSPNFLYELLSPSWTEVNQLVRVDYGISAELASKIRDDERYHENQVAFETLTDRTIASPNRGDRLRKYVIDAINGLPDGSDPRSLLGMILSDRVGYQVTMRPTKELVETIYRHAFGWGPLEAFMLEGAGVTELMVNRHDGVFVERTIPGLGSRLVEEQITFESPFVLARFVDRMVEQAGKSINFEEPTVDMSLPDGSRVNVTIPPTSRFPSITIRRKREQFYTLDELLGFGSFSPEMRAFFTDLNVSGANMITYGPTGSGKTTLLTALLDDKNPERRLVIVEDTAEINVDVRRHPNTVWMLTGEHRTMRDLVKNALRMRPDHLVVGETRDATAYDLVQAFNSGQTGSISTIHARDPQSALTRLTNLVRQAEAAPTEEPARRMVAEAINVLVFASRLGDGSRRIMRVDEVVDLDDAFNFQVQSIFRGERAGTDERGRIKIDFIHNPDYTMGPALAALFRSNGLDPDRWTGAAAKKAGKRASSEEV